MPRKLKPFGAGSSTRDMGYTLSFLIGHLDSLVEDESFDLKSDKGPKAKRLEKVEAAKQLLYEAQEMGGEE